MNQDATFASTKEKTKDVDVRMNRPHSPHDKGPDSVTNQMDQTDLTHTNGQDSARRKTHPDHALPHENNEKWSGAAAAAPRKVPTREKARNAKPGGKARRVGLAAEAKPEKNSDAIWQNCNICGKRLKKTLARHMQQVKINERRAHLFM